jgi:hypothetical protein
MHKCLPISFLKRNRGPKQRSFANAGMALQPLPNVPFEGFQIAKESLLSDEAALRKTQKEITDNFLVTQTN